MIQGDVNGEETVTVSLGLLFIAITKYQGVDTLF